MSFPIPSSHAQRGLGRGVGRAFLAAAALLAGLGEARAAVITKSGTGTVLTDGASWGGTAPGSGDVATWISTSLGTSLTLGTNVSWQGIDVQGAAGAIGITGAGTLTLGASGITIAAAGQNLTIGNTLAIGGNQTFTVGSGRSLTLNVISSASAVNLAYTGAGTIVMNQTGSGFNASGTVTLSGGVTWQMATANSQVTATWFGSSGASGTGAAVTFDGATLRSNGGTSRHLNNNVVIKTGGMTIGGSAGVTLHGTVGLNAGTTANTTLTTSAALTLNGVVGNGGFKKAGSSSLKLMGTNTYAGGTDLSAGTLYLGNASALGGGTLAFSAAATLASDSATARSLANGVNLTASGLATFGDATGTGNLTFTTLALSDAGGNRSLSVFNAAQTLTFSGAVSGASTGTFTKQGSGTLILGSASNTYAATTVALAAGTLQIAAANALGGANVTMASSTVDTTLQASGAVTLASGQTITVGNSTTAAAKAIFKNVNTGAGVTFEIASKITPGAGATGPVQIAASSAPSSGTNIVRLSNDANDFGALTVGSGTLEFTSVANGGSASALGKDAGAYALANGSSGLNLRYAGSVATSTNRALDWQGTTGGLTLENAGSGTVQYLNSGSLKSGVGAATLTLAGSNVGENILAQAVSDNGANAIALTKSGAGTWKLTSTSSNFSGKITAVGGDLQLHVLPNGGAIAYNGGWVTYVGATSISSDRLIQIGTVGGTPVARLRNNGAGALDMTATGDITQAGGITGGSLLLGGSNAGDNYLRSRIVDIGAATIGLAKADAGKWILTGANTYTGATSVDGGTLRVDGSLAAASAVTVKSGAVLAGRGTVSGAATIQSGGAVTAGDGALGTLTLGSLAFDGAGTINVGTFSNYEVSSALVVGSLSAGGAAGSVTVNVGGASAINGFYNLLSYTGAIGGTGGSAFVLGTSPGVSSRQTASLIDTGSVLQYKVEGATPYWTGLESSEWSTVVSTGDKNWKLDSNNDKTDFLAGDVVIFNDLATGTTADVSVADIAVTTILVGGAKDFAFTGSRSITAGSLSMSGSGTLTISSANSFGGGTTLSSGTIVMGTATALGSGTITLNGGTLDLNGQAVANGISLGGGALISDGATIGGAIVNGLANTLTVDSSLTLTGVNTYTGATTLTAGTLEISGAGQLGGGNYSGNIANAGTLKFSTSASQTLAGVISGAGELIKGGAGTLTLTGVSTYTGATTITEGTLAVSGAGQLGGGAYDKAIANAGTLSIGSSSNQTFSGVISGTGELIKGGAGTLTLTGVSTYTGATTITGGTLEVGGSGQLGSGTYARDIANTGTLKFSTSSNQTLSGVISGGGGLAKSGGGRLILTGVNTFSGDIALDGGTLEIAGSGQLGSGTYAGTISGAGALVKSSAAAQTLSGNSSYSGGTTISTGTLTLGHANALGGVAAGLVAVGTGATLDLGAVAPNIRGLVLSGTAAVTSASAGKLTLGSGGIDMGAASANLTLSGAGFGVGIGADQTWNVAAGRTLTVTPANASGNFGGTGKITVQGSGIVTLSGARDAFANFGGVWQIDAGAEVRNSVSNGLSTGGAAWGSQALILNGGTAAFNADAYSGWSNAITVSANSTIKNYSGGSYVRRQVLTGAITASAGTSLTFENAGLMNASGAYGFMLGNNNPDFKGTLNVGNGTSNSTVAVLFGGSHSQDYNANNVGNLAAEAVVDLRNGSGKSVIGFNRTGSWTFASTIQGSGDVIVGTYGGSAQVVTLSGTNSYAGLTKVLAATLRLGSASALGAAGGLASNRTEVSSGAVIDLNGQTVVAEEALTLSGSGISGGGALVNSSAAAATFGGLLTLAGDTGLVAGAGDITLANTGTIAGSGFGLTVSGAGNITVASAIGTAAGNLTKRGTGSLTLTGASTYTGSTSVENGTLVLAGGDNRLAATAAVVLGAVGTGGKLALGNAASASNQTLAGLAIAGNGGGVVGGNAAVSTLTLELAVDSRFDGALGGVGANEDNLALVKSGGAVLTLATANTYAGGTTIQAGGLAIGHASALGAGPLTLAGGAIDNASGAALVLAGDLAQGWNANFTFAGTHDLDLGAGEVTLGADVQVTVEAGNLTVGGVISGLTYGLTKAGEGTLTLNGANLYGGDTVINAGRLVIGDAQALGSGAIDVFGGVLDLGGNNIANVLNLHGGKLEGLASYTGTVAVTTSHSLDDANAGFSGVMEVASGTLTLGNDDALGTTSAGRATILDGAALDLNGRTLAAAGLTIGGQGGIFGALHNGSTTVATHNGTLTLTSTVTVGGDGDIVLGGVVSDGASASGLTKSGTGTLTLEGANTYEGLTTVGEGKLVVNGSIKGDLVVAGTGALGGSGTITGNATIDGLHAPGNSPAVQSFGGNLSYGAGSSIEWELFANQTIQQTPAVFDQIIVAGDLFFTGAATLNLVFDAAGSGVDWNLPFWEQQRTWTILTFGGDVHGLENLTLSQPLAYLDGAGKALADWHQATFAITRSGNSILLTYAPVPEPGTYGLALGALALAAAAVRRRRAMRAGEGVDAAR